MERVQIYAIVLLLFYSTTIVSSQNSDNTICEDLSEMILTDILGPAYNSRYMSIKEPRDEPEPTKTKNSQNTKRAPTFSPFYVDKDFAEIIADEPAWNVNHFDPLNIRINNTSPKIRKKRAMPRPATQWECISKVIWKDLGPDYFPRYLRTVECITKVCWYGHYRCRPRSFTVKLLKRRRNRCITAEPNTKIGTNGLHKDLKQLWVWEERAVNFCCDCAL